ALPILFGLEGVVERRTEELGASRERYRQLVEGSRDIFYRATLDPFRMEYVSPQIATTLGVTPEEVYADPTLVFRLRSDEHDDPLADLATWDEAPVQLRYRRRPDDQAVWLEHRVNAQRDPATGRVVAIEGVARDITELKAVESVLAHRASHDPLTELPNRQVFFDRL